MTTFIIHKQLSCYESINEFFWCTRLCMNWTENKDTNSYAWTFSSLIIEKKNRKWRQKNSVHNFHQFTPFKKIIEYSHFFCSKVPGNGMTMWKLFARKLENYSNLKMHIFLWFLFSRKFFCVSLRKIFPLSH